jgi:putative transcriptional regulator
MSTKGRLLVATPLLGDPNFDRTVVLMIEDNDDGALGVVLNRPTPIEVLEPLPEWIRFVGHPSVVFLGGPVSRGSVLALAQVDAGAVDDFEPVLGSIGVLDLSLDPDTLGGIGEVRFFTGYAGWGPRQLDAEIDEAAWFVVDADPNDALTTDPDDLWSTVLRRQPPPLRRFALYPDDIAAN